ncbi:MAG: hypothetical protein R2795_06130 [Saprospiraceae bacterium]
MVPLLLVLYQLYLLQAVRRLHREALTRLPPRAAGFIASPGRLLVAKSVC